MGGVMVNLNLNVHFLNLKPETRKLDVFNYPILFEFLAKKIQLLALL